MATTITYPEKYPHPTRAGFAAVANTGVRRVGFESGYHRQRRFFTSLPTEITLTFVLPYSDFKDWVDWMNEFAFDWFNMPAIPSHRVDNTDICSTGEEIRLVSDLNWSMVGHDHVQITCAAEFKV